MSSECISALQCNVELLRELRRSFSGILVKVNTELSLGFSAWQTSQHWTKHPPGNLVPVWVSSRLPGAYLCSICVVSVNVVMFCFLHKVPVSWLHAFVHAGQGTVLWRKSYSRTDRSGRRDMLVFWPFPCSFYILSISLKHRIPYFCWFFF